MNSFSGLLNYLQKKLFLHKMRCNALVRFQDSKNITNFVEKNSPKYSNRRDFFYNTVYIHSLDNTGLLTQPVLYTAVL